MKDRLLRFIRYVCGRQSVFADRMGWDRQYLSKLCRGIGLGVTPVRSVLREFPELDARWLLLGDGEMLCSSDSERQRLLADAYLLVAQTSRLAAYIPVMSVSELSEFSHGRVDFPSEAFARWESHLGSSTEVEDLKTSNGRAS